MTFLEVLVSASQSLRWTSARSVGLVATVSAVWEALLRSLEDPPSPCRRQAVVYTESHDVLILLRLLERDCSSSYIIVLSLYVIMLDIY